MTSASATNVSAGHHDGTNFIAMEHLEGVTLREKSGGNMGVGDLIRHLPKHVPH